MCEIKTNGEVTDIYGYNAAGAVTKHNDTVYIYDRWGKLSGVSKADGDCSYKYDADGLRTYKTGTRYFVDLNGSVISETDEETDAVIETVYGTQALARKVGGAWYYYIYNAHGDVIGMTDESGNVVNSYEYDAWGNVISKTACDRWGRTFSVSFLK